MSQHTIPAKNTDLCEQEATLATSHQTAIDRVKATFEAEGFRQVTQFCPSDRIDQVPGDGSGPYTVVGFGIPDAAEHALETADKRVGVLFPCNVLIWETDEGTQQVYTLDTLGLAPELGFADPDESWGALVAQLEKLMADAFDALDPTDNE